MYYFTIMDFDFSKAVQSKTDAELTDAYINSGSYQPEYIALVLQEIQKRNLPIDDMEAVKAENTNVALARIAVGRQGNTIYMILCFALALLGGLLGIIAGYIYATSTHKGPDGNLYYVYNDTTRKLGYGILVTGVIILFVSIMKTCNF